MNKELIKKDSKDKFSEFRKTLNSWDLTPGAPKDEFGAEEMTSEIMECWNKADKLSDYLK